MPSGGEGGTTPGLASGDQHYRRFARRTAREPHRDAVISEQISWTIRAATAGKFESLKEASFPLQSLLMRQDRSALIGSIASSCKRALRVLCKIKAVPAPMRVVVIGIAFLAVCCL